MVYAPIYLSDIITKFYGVGQTDDHNSSNETILDDRLVTTIQYEDNPRHYRTIERWARLRHTEGEM